MNKKKTEELTWAEVKAMFAENERRFAESRAEFDRSMAESRAEFDRSMVASRAEFDKRQAEADKRQAEADKRQAEADKRQAEADKRQAEADRSMAASRAEADKRKAELDKQWAETDKRLDKLCKQVGGIDDNAGHHAEQFFQDSFAQTLAFGGEKYDFMLPNLKSMNKSGSIEFDIVLVNGESVAIIEVKNRIHPGFVKDLAEKRIVKFRQYFPGYKEHKAYLGIAGFSFCEDVVDEAQKLGVGIIKQVGNSIEIDAEHLKAY